MILEQEAGLGNEGKEASVVDELEVIVGYHVTLNN
jgi:hypothetical protein